MLEAIENVGSRLEKEKILAHVDDETFEFLRLALDPDVTFGVTVDEAAQRRRWREFGPPHLSPTSWTTLLMDTLEQLRTRHKTGNAALATVDSVMAVAPSEVHVKWACRVINRELRLGIQSKTLNKLFPGSVKKFQVSLAEPYDPERHELRGCWLLEPKLDGIRMVVVDGVGRTRNGKAVETVGHILDALPEEVKRDWVLDGELLGSGGFDAGSGVARRKGRGAQTELRYHVFDVVRREEWESRRTRLLCERKKDLTAVLASVASPAVCAVDWREVTDPSHGELVDACNGHVLAGYEGVMAKDAVAQYVFDRSSSVIKLKPFKDVDGVVVGCYEGKNRHVGRLGGLNVSVDGVVTDVGGGFSDAQREEFWRERDTLVGKVAEVQYQEMTKDGALRFPVFIRWREDKC